MSLSRDDAAKSLKDIEAAAALSTKLKEYETAAPHFLIWGLVWAVAYATSAAMPELRNTAWPVAVALGVLGSTIAGAFEKGAYRTPVWVSAAVAAVITVFIFAIVTVADPQNTREIEALIPLIFAAGYTLAGLFLGVRFFICGVVLGAGTVAGFMWAGPNFGYWMAVLGGGTLILTGLWLRRV
jgi:hypothetical protein